MTMTSYLSKNKVQFTWCSAGQRPHWDLVQNSHNYNFSSHSPNLGSMLMLYMKWIIYGHYYETGVALNTTFLVVFKATESHFYSIGIFTQSSIVPAAPVHRVTHQPLLPALDVGGISFSSVVPSKTITWGLPGQGHLGTSQVWGL